MAPKIVDKEAKKMEILLAAMQVFAQKGTANTKMIDIAKSAGIGKGTIYEYFSSKEDIFLTGFQHFFEDFEKNITAAIKKNHNPQKQLETLIRTSINTFFGEHLDFAVIILDFWAEGVRTKAEAINDALNLKQIYQGYRSMIVEIINAGIEQGVFRKLDPVPYASFLIGAMDGLMLQWVMEPELFDVNQVADALCEGMLSGIKKSSN